MILKEGLAWEKYLVLSSINLIYQNVVNPFWNSNLTEYNESMALSVGTVFVLPARKI